MDVTEQTVQTLDVGSILVADAASTDLDQLCMSLRSEGFAVAHAPNCAQVLRMVADDPPDLLLLDIDLNDGEGFEICQALKHEEPTAAIPVIFTSRRNSTRDKLRAFECGGSDYVTKPCHPSEIVARAAVHIRLRKAEQTMIREHEEAATLAAKLAESNLKLAKLNRVDPLTQVLNRRAWEECALVEQTRSQRNSRAYSILMVDVDHFKRFNDHQGHQAGDACLRQIAACLSSACRVVDIVGRFGGEEFVVLAPDTHLNDAIVLGERIRRAVWNLGITHPTSSVAARVTCSVGVAVGGGGNWEETLSRADDALYRAKKSGRDAVRADAPACDADAIEDESALDTTGGVSPPPASQRTVVIVDDDERRRDCYAPALVQAGYQVASCADTESAWATIREHEPQVIVVDAELGRVSGLECVESLKSDPEVRDIPILVIGIHPTDATASIAHRVGAEEFISDSADPSEIVQRVCSMERLYRERCDLTRSYELRGEQTRVLTLLLDYCKALASCGNLDEALEHTVTITAHVTSCSRVSIMLPDRSGEYLRIAAGLGIDVDVQNEISIGLGEPIAGRVFATGQATVVNEIDQADPLADRYPSPYYVSVPMATAHVGDTDSCVGVINITGRIARQPFEPRELEYIELIAGFAASAIHSILNHIARDEALESIVIALAKLAEHRDNETAFHVERVTRYARLLAEELRNHPDFMDLIDDEYLHDLDRATPLHDIGKVAVPDRILFKPGRLTEDEMAIMRRHAELGAKTIRSVLERAPAVSFLEMAEQISLHHHERIDGKGYPCGLANRAIPLCARIVTLADVYDALTTRRVYKPAYSHEKTRGIILENYGTQFDPAVVDAFLKHEDEFARLAEELRNEHVLDHQPDVDDIHHEAIAEEKSPAASTTPSTPASSGSGHLPAQFDDPAVCRQFEQFLEELGEKVTALGGAMTDADIDALVIRAQQISNESDPQGTSPVARLAWKLQRAIRIRAELEQIHRDVDALNAPCRRRDNA